MKKTTPSTLPDGHERLERLIAHLGLASRREAKDLIREKQVTVNGTIITEPGYGVLESDRIVISKHTAEIKQSVLIYKPRGIETNATSPGAKDLHTAFPQYAHLAPIGRLDKESEGLIIMSNDGTLASALTKVGSHVGKTYLVTTREKVSESALRKMQTGIILDKIITKPARTQRTGDASFKITLSEGRKHQIRRMCDACRLTITSLVRTNIGTLSIGSMKSGSARTLSSSEISRLKI